MNTQVDTSIIQKVKMLLQVEDELSSIELLKLLKDYRMRLHPDKFIKEEARKEATEKFKELGNTIEELSRYIENEKLRRGAKELALYEPLYDNLSLQNELDVILGNNKELEKQVNVLKGENEKLKEALSQKDSDELESENSQLKQLYKPSNQKLASLGILFLLSSSFAIMTKIDEVSSIIKKYSPLSEILLNKIIFGLFILMLILVIKQYVENKLISIKVGEVCSPRFSAKFCLYLKYVKNWEDDKTKDFSEEDVFHYIYGKERKFKSLLAKIGFRLYQIETGAALLRRPKISLKTTGYANRSLRFS